MTPLHRRSSPEYPTHTVHHTIANDRNRLVGKPFVTSPAAQMSTRPPHESIGEPKQHSDQRTRRRLTRSTVLPRWMRSHAGQIGTVAVLALLAAVIAWPAVVSQRPAPAEVAFSSVAAAIATGEVSAIEVLDDGSRIVATLGNRASAAAALLSTQVPGSGVSLADMERWSASGIVVNVRRTSPFRSPESALMLLPAILLGVVGGLLIWRARGSGARFTTTAPERRLSMAEVGGAHEARADLQDVIAFLADPERFRRMGARCPRGVLLVGPPGTGKTLLARAVAGEAGVPMITAAGSDFNEKYVGVGASRVRALARRARGCAPCIVFIDEFESLGGRRGRANRSGEEENTLNQLLVEMDGMGGTEGVIWMAATNREDMLDPAVRRPGRFDRVVEVPLPTVGDRAAILRIHARNAPLAPDVDLDLLAGLTPGHSGAELANLLNEAALIAVHEHATRITAAHIEQARDKILLGRVRAGVVVSESERRLVALHEAGHAVVGLVACPEDRLHKVTIQARGRSLGAAHFAPDVDRHLYTRTYMEGLIAKSLGGRAAEVVFLGDAQATSGAGSDLVYATSVARRMAAEFGMTDRVGLVSADPEAQGGAVSQQLQSRVDEAVAALVSAQADRSVQIVREHRAAVEAIADALLQHDVLDAGQVLSIAAVHGIAANPAIATPSVTATAA